MQVLSAHVQGFHTPEIVSRAVTLYHGDVLPFAFHDVIACVLRVIVLYMCKCMCSAGAVAGTVCACTRCRCLYRYFFMRLLQHLRRCLYATIFVYIVSHLYHWFNESYEVQFFLSFLSFLFRPSLTGILV